MSDLIAEFTLWGNPVPKQRPRHGKWNTYTPAKTRQAEKDIRAAFTTACPGWDATVDNVRLEADFYRRTRGRCDGDNLFKTVTDALNQVAYRDDSQIAEGEFRRFYGAGDRARTEVRVYVLGGDPDA